MLLNLMNYQVFVCKIVIKRKAKKCYFENHKIVY